MKKIRLLLIEDNRLLRDGITAMLKNQPDIKIIAASGKNEDTLIKIQKLKPNVVLLDLGLRNQNSLTVVEIVKKDFPKAKVIVMDLAPIQGDINLFVKAGASGFILKDATLDELLLTIRSVADGANVIAPDLTESLFTHIVKDALKGGKTKLTEAIRMTKREREIIRLIGDGLSNKEIGQKLVMSIFTVKSHIHNIMEKLALHTRLEVANYSYSSGTLKKVVGDFSMIG
jgi:DNA-binding NarL/FixJ family response regulator